jgi:hypothetical protein
MTAVGRRFHSEIAKFFEGKDHWELKEKQEANIWVAKHDGFDTLTIEPREGGQFEVAVRILQEDPLNAGKRYAGYWVDSSLHGVNTSGH